MSAARIKLLTFDLDDTLWELGPVLIRAETVGYRWLHEHIPAVTRQFSIEQLRDIRMQIAREQLELAHRVTDLRKLSLHRAMTQTGIDASAIPTLVDAAFRVFLQARHEVELFADAEAALQQLQRRFHLGRDYQRQF